MKKIKFLQPIAGYNPQGESFGYALGDEAEIETELASAWVASGIAEFISESPKKAEFAVSRSGEKIVASKPVVKAAPAPAPTPEAPKVEDTPEPKVEVKEDK